jgi:hypothetical protein
LRIDLNWNIRRRFICCLARWPRTHFCTKIADFSFRRRNVSLLMASYLISANSCYFDFLATVCDWTLRISVLRGGWFKKWSIERNSLEDGGLNWLEPTERGFNERISEDV